MLIIETLGYCGNQLFHVQVVKNCMPGLTQSCLIKKGSEGRVNNMMNSDGYNDSLKGFNRDTRNAGESTFETWKKFVLGQTGRPDGSLPFAYKDPLHTQMSSTQTSGGTRNGWLDFPMWTTESIGLGGLQSTSWWDTLGLSRTQRYIGFGLCLLFATLFFMLSMMYIPIAVIRPAKFAMPYCMASLLVFLSFGFLLGFVNYSRHLVSRERLPFSILFFGSTLMTLYGATKNLGYIFTVMSVLIQLVCLVVYVISYVPGGQSGISVMSSIVGSSVRGRLGV